jgi:hypothetical protein
MFTSTKFKRNPPWTWKKNEQQTRRSCILWDVCNLLRTRPLGGRRGSPSGTATVVLIYWTWAREPTGSLVPGDSEILRRPSSRPHEKAAYPLVPMFMACAKSLFRTVTPSSSGSIPGYSMCDIRNGQRQHRRTFFFQLFSPSNHHSTIAPYSSPPPPVMWDSPDHAAQYHILGLQVRGFISDPARGCLHSKHVTFMHLRF